MLKNKYILTAGAFAVWMLFFDNRDVITTHFKQRSELNRLEESKTWYEKEISKTRAELEQLRSDQAILEKYAREHYRMKKDNEDLFVISENPVQ
ncbi:MAG: septum formation initiator family protein [Chitinophagaceae bacterium]|nr:septum formation initiator family protein [Chitinophagaceae bacterium]